MFDFNALETMVNEMIVTANTSVARKRAILASRYLMNYAKDSGCAGRINELYSASHGSHKASVSVAGKRDVTIKVIVDGKRGNYAAEVKTNGGRIESLYLPNAPKYVIYAMNLQNSLVKVRRTVEPKLIPTSTFLTCLEELNAVKMTNGSHNERAIQVTKKELYERLLDWPIDYDPETIYEDWEFEGLGL